MKQRTLQIRLTLAIVLLLSMTSILLSLMLNYSAVEMTQTLEMTPLVSSGSGEEIMAVKLTPAMTKDPFFISVMGQAKRVFKLKSISYTGLIIVVGGILTYYMTGYALRPIRTLSDQMKSIDVNNLNQSLATHKMSPDMKELALSFNNMTDKLYKAFEVQKRFSANAAHELKTPIAVLQTRVEVFSKRLNPTKKDSQKLVDTVLKHTDRMANLVEHLLELTEGGPLESLEHIDLYGLMAHLIGAFEPIASSKNITISLSGSHESLYGHYALLYRAFYNLLDNAIKYNCDHGCVHVEVTHSKGAIVVRVSDQGLGITFDEKQDIFEPFYRVDPSRARAIGGSGLGLSIVKTILDRHEASIHVYDNKPQGSIFTVTWDKEKQVTL